MAREGDSTPPPERRSVLFGSDFPSDFRNLDYGAGAEQPISVQGLLVGFDLRLRHLESSTQEIKGVLARLEPLIQQMHTATSQILPTLATKHEIAGLATKEVVATKVSWGRLLSLIGILAAVAVAAVTITLQLSGQPSP